MKRFICVILLSALMCCLFAACSGKSNNNAPTGTNESVAESVPGEDSETGLSTDTLAEDTTSSEDSSIETDPSESEPPETTPAESEPAETTPSESKPAETDLTESEPVETSPEETSDGIGWETNSDGSIDLPIVPFAS